MDTHEQRDKPEDDIRRQKAHSSFAASHQARHAARQQGNNGDGGENSLDAKPKEESAAEFGEAFNQEIADISDGVAKLVEDRMQTAAGTGISGARHASASQGASGEDIGVKLDGLVDRVKGLRQRTAEATLFLPAYDVRRANEEAAKLLASVETTRAEVAPRKKFSFRSKRSGTGANAVGRPGVASRTAVDPKPAVTRGLETEETDGLGLRGMKAQIMEISAENADKDKDFNLSDLDTCTVRILHVIGALRLRRLTSCRVICGPVRGPIYVEACKDCVVVAAGRQLRIHDSEHVDFYVFVASGPIIEDCASLRFAPSRLRYTGCEEQFQEAGLFGVTNAWEDVKDFKWHRAQKSPNWDVIPEADREIVSLAVGATPPKH